MLKRTLDSFRRHGAAGFFDVHLGARFRRYVFNSRPCTLIHVFVDDYPFRYLRKRSFCDVVKITSPEQLDRYQAPEIDKKRSFMNRWIGRGDHFFLGVKDGEPVGFIDLSMVRFHDREGLVVEVFPERGECKVRDIQVFPKFRRTVAVGLLHDVAIEYAKEHGFTRVVGAIYMEKEPALKASKRIGFREYERQQCYRLFHWFYWHRKVWRAPTPEHDREMTW